MSQLTADISRKYKVDNTDIRADQPVDAAVSIFAGAFVGQNGSTNLARQLVGGDSFLGIADAAAINVANPIYPNLLGENGALIGAAGALFCSIRADGILVVPLAAVEGATGAANIQAAVYASDSNTLALGTYTSVLTETGTPTGGTFTLTVTINSVAGTTAAIAQAATAAQVQSALAALTNLGTTTVTVTGSAGGPWTAEFYGSQPTIALGTNSFTGGSSPSLTVGAVTAATNTSKIGVIQSYLNGNLEIRFLAANRKVS